jgi:hypothetical protein
MNTLLINSAGCGEPCEFDMQYTSDEYEYETADCYDCLGNENSCDSEDAVAPKDLLVSSSGLLCSFEHIKWKKSVDGEDENPDRVLTPVTSRKNSDIEDTAPVSYKRKRFTESSRTAGERDRQKKLSCARRLF